MLGAAVAALALGMSTTPATAHDEPSVRVVVTGLNNPRQIAVDWADWSVYVAEAGSGGTQCDDTGCHGRTGSITWIRKPSKTSNSGTPQRIVSNLPSTAAPDGSFAVGVQGVDAVNRKVWAVFAGGQQELPGSPEGGKLVSYAKPGAQPKVVADIEKYELDHNPGGDPTDVHSNPYSVLALADRQVVADAGANTVYEVRNGQVKVLAVLPGGPGSEGPDGTQQVPTAVTRGPNGDYYVGVMAESAGPNGARIFVIGENGGIKRTIDGFESVHGIAFDALGDMYVSELFRENPAGPPGRVVRVDSDDARRTFVDVPFPAGLAVDNRNRVYVAAWSISDADGSTDPESGQTTPGGQIWEITNF